MTTPTAAGNQRNSDHVGDRIELGRYRTAAGVDRVLYGQRVATVVRFQPGRGVVLVASSCRSEDGRCRPREALLETASHVRVLDGANDHAREGRS